MFNFSQSPVVLGMALAGGLALSGGASALTMTDMSQGYLVVAAADTGGKSVEGKCGEDKFAKTDTNHDGKVDRAEFNAAAPERAAEFDKIDANNDGGITLPEAEHYLAGKKGAEGKCGEGKCGAAIES